MTITAGLHREGAWIAAFCPELQEANGQGKTEEEAPASLRAAIDLVFADRREDAHRRAVTTLPLRTLELIHS